MGHAIFWHRRDLRMEDNAGLHKALKSGKKVQPVFIFDETILSKLPKNDQRVLFIHQEVTRLQQEYLKLGSDLKVFYGNPIDVIPRIVKDNKVSMVFTNRDYEPYALERDKALVEILDKMDVPFHGAKDHVIFEKAEITKADGLPYTIFTPYMNKWKATWTPYQFKPYPTEKYFGELRQRNNIREIPSMEAMGFEDKQLVDFPSRIIENKAIPNYHENRDIPSVLGTSRLSLHLRFGTISVRELAKHAQKTNEKYLNELIWRDFYQMILWHFPHSATSSFKKQYDRVPWNKDEKIFKAWCVGKTGFPMVDAGMRELNATGFMHNRVRMVVASFLTKLALIDWRLGEAYFAEKLLDFELASNVGGWQWASSSGCDAAPYFRIFNPQAQFEKFDKKEIYVKKWVPEYGTAMYAKPIVDYKIARQVAIDSYKEALKDQ